MSAERQMQYIWAAYELELTPVIRPKVTRLNISLAELQGRRAMQAGKKPKISDGCFSGFRGLIYGGREKNMSEK